MVWGAGKFVVKAARVYRVKAIGGNFLQNYSAIDNLNHKSDFYTINLYEKLLCMVPWRMVMERPLNLVTWQYHFCLHLLPIFIYEN